MKLVHIFDRECVIEYRGTITLIIMQPNSKQTTFHYSLRATFAQYKKETFIYHLFASFSRYWNKRKVWKMKSVRTQHSICWASAKKWIQLKRWTSKHSHTKMVQLHRDTLEQWALARQAHTCIHDLVHSPW